MSTSNDSVKKLYQQVRECRICEPSLPLGPGPVFQCHPDARILIAGQAPGKKVHHSRIPFDDPSGRRLREWMQIDSETFYDETRIAILPMGFCFPGSGKSGDLPPRPECAGEWREKMLSTMPNIQLTLVLGQYAREYHLGKSKESLTETVKNWKSYWPEILPLPHPSPRNMRWFKNNPWYEGDILPTLRKTISELLNH